MTTAKEMRTATDKYYDVKSLKKRNKNYKWANKVIKKISKRAKKGYGWAEVKIPKFVDKYWATPFFEGMGFKTTEGSTHYRLTW